MRSELIAPPHFLEYRKGSDLADRGNRSTRLKSFAAISLYPGRRPAPIPLDLALVNVLGAVMLFSIPSMWGDVNKAQADVPAK